MTERLLTTVCLVGDQFAQFATHQSVRTVSGFVAEVRAGCFDNLRGPLSISWGQGITTYDRDFVRDGLRSRGLLDSVLLESEEPAVVSRSRTHKQREANAVLAGLRSTGDDTYRASLRLHPENEFLLDHQSGEHLQGMVVIEAFRQMFISVCEQFVAVRWPDRRYSYIWHGMDLRFQNFLFPVQADVECRVRDADLDDPGRLRMTVDLTVHQAGQKCASAGIEFTAFDKDGLVPKEHRAAGKTIDAVLAGATPVDTPRLLEVV
ncbi:MAG TPA: AfsA-related hotdog domain-containing protein [Sporichthyaceae bacterium]|jgi:hypothetical protein|nr:AfsA-related hotdog domain-containing protein [Sporichthyaceae bacterium]